MKLKIIEGSLEVGSAPEKYPNCYVKKLSKSWREYGGERYQYAYLSCYHSTKTVFHSRGKLR